MPIDKKGNHLKVTIKYDGIILWVAFHMFDILRQISVFHQIRNISQWMWNCSFKSNFKRKHPDATVLIEETLLIKEKCWNKYKPFTAKHLFPEVWVLANILFSIIGCFVVGIKANEWICWIFCIYAILRTFELFVYQINVLLFDPIKFRGDKYKVKSATRTVLLLICNMFEYVLWFSVVYLFMIKGQMSFHENFQVIMKSVTTLANIDSPEEQFKHVSIIYVAYIESVIGIFMNIVCLARFISLLPSVEINDET